MPRSPRPPLSKEAAQARARIAVAARLNPGSPEEDAARRDFRAVKLHDHIQEVISTWPPLTDEQRAKLSDLLAPARAAIREHRLAALEAQPATIP